jgi:hypothetical protein
MQARFTVRFTFADAADDSIHRIRNFAEDLHRAVTRDGVGHVENMDTAVTFVSVRVGSKQNLGKAAALVRALLERHHLAEDAVIER